MSAGEEADARTAGREPAAGAAARSLGLLASVSGAHFVSHLHILTVPALLPVLAAEYGVGFASLGMAVAIFNIVSAIVQAPLGFAVDRWGARPVLLGGLALGSASFLLPVALPGYAPLVVAMVGAGLANGVYHPANYSLLSRGIAPGWMGRAFSVHTFAGFLGGAVSPVLLVAAVGGGTRLAFGLAGAAGLAAFAAVLLRTGPPPRPAPATVPVGAGAPRPALVTPAIAGLVVLFALLSLSAGPIERFSVSALVASGTPLPLANTALAGFLIFSTLGVLLGGILADRTSRHGLLAGTAFGASGLAIAAVAAFDLPPPALVACLALAGLLMGVIAPSRDMLVRAASPPGQEGKVFGIVTTGFNLGGVVGPPLFGLLIDRGHPEAVLWSSVVFVALTLVVIGLQNRPARPHDVSGSGPPTRGS